MKHKILKKGSPTVLFKQAPDPPLDLSRIEEIKEAAKTVKRHWSGVLRWYVSRINNGILEGLNSLVQAAKAKATGYINPTT